MKTVLVTGAGCRIGAAIAAELEARGWNVLRHSHRRDGDGFINVDFTRENAAGVLMAKAIAADAGICAIVNNAALFDPSATPAPEMVEAMRQVNFEVPEKLTSMLGMRLMTNHESCGRAAGNGCGLPSHGAVVDILDTRVLHLLDAEDLAGIAPYARFKLELWRSMRRAAGLFAESLRINAVAPGPVLPPSGGVSEAAGEMLLDCRPTPEDVARTVAFLLETGGITGTVVPVDAGQHLLR